MRTSWNRAAAAAVNPCAASLLVAAGLFVGGCENSTERADRNLRDAAAKVYDADARGANPQQALTALTAAANTGGISNTAKVGAKLRLAEAEITAADALARQAADREIDAARLVGDARRLTAQVRANNALIALYRAAEPKAARDLVATQTDAANKGGAGVWGDGTGDTLPAKAVIAEQVKTLTREVADLQSKRAALDAEATKSSQQADQLMAQAEKVKGQKGLDLGIEAANLRKKARDDAAQIDVLDVNLSRAQQDLKVAQARGPGVDETIKALAGRSTQFDATWEGAQTRIKEMTALSEKVLGKSSAGGAATAPAADAATPVAPDAPEGTATPAPATQPLTKELFEAYREGNTINATLERIAALVMEAATRRQQALDLYDKARQHTQEAQTAATAARSEVSGWVSKGGTGSTQTAAWNGLKDSLNEGQFTFQLAVIDDKIAAARSTGAGGMAIRAEFRGELEPVLQTAALTLPPALQTTGFGDAASVKAESDVVAQSYQAAAQQFLDVAGGRAGSPLADVVAKNAKVAQANTYYAHSQFAARMGDTASAQTLWGNAVAVFADESGPMPSALAPEIALAAHPAAPATQPTTAPSAEPSAPGTPATEPSAPVVPPADAGATPTAPPPAGG